MKLDNLSKREKIIVPVALVILLCFIIFQFLLTPALRKNNQLKKTIARKEKQIIEMKDIQQELVILSKDTDYIATLLKKRKQGFSLFSFLDQSANNSDVKKHISYMKPGKVSDYESLKQSLVEMKLQSIELNHLVSFLEKIESAENIVNIRRISIQENTKSKETLDVLLQIVSIDEVLD